MRNFLAVCLSFILIASSFPNLATISAKASEIDTMQEEINNEKTIENYEKIDICCTPFSKSDGSGVFPFALTIQYGLLDANTAWNKDLLILVVLNHLFPTIMSMGKR